MSDNIENHLTLTQKYTILLLSANNNQPITGKVWFQKELFLVSQNLPRLEDEAEFEGSLMGPFSENADAELDHLRIEGLVELDGKIKLTQKGQEVADRLKLKTSKETFEILSDMKSFINDLTEDEMLAFVYFSYPDMTLESIELDRIRERRAEIAVSLYRKRKVSIGKAAFIAGLSQEDFIRKARANGITIFSE
jgi:predicted HTH domain antitoxin